MSPRFTLPIEHSSFVPQVFTTFVELLPSEKQYTHHAIRKYDANLKSEFKKKKITPISDKQVQKKRIKRFLFDSTFYNHD